MEPLAEADPDNEEDSNREAQPVPWGRLMKLSGGSAVALMPRPEQPQGRALNEVTLGRGKVRIYYAFLVWTLTFDTVVP